MRPALHVFKIRSRKNNSSIEDKAEEEEPRSKNDLILSA